jgi:anti-sigma factor RsiW
MTGERACADALTSLSLSLDQELSPLERCKLERHLLGCPDCRHKGASVEAITLALRDLPSEEPSVSLLPHLSWRHRAARTSLLATTAVVIAASLGLVTLQGSVGTSSGDMNPVLTGSSTPNQLPVSYATLPQPQPYASSAVQAR